MTIQELRRRVLDRCRADPDYYVESFVHIEDKDADELIQPFKLWDGQKQALNAFAAERRVVVLKARQLGFTWLALAEASRLLLTHTGRTVVGLSRSETEAKELVRRLGVIFRYMPELIAEYPAPPGWNGPVFQERALDLTVMFPEGPESVFQAFASNPNAARSFTADLVILDEWAFQPYASEIWQAAFPTINRPTGGRIIGLSTIKLGTLFEEIWTNPGNGFKKLFLPWSADPRRTEKWYAETVANMGEAKTRQEYPATPEEALEAPGGRFFSELEKRHLGKEPTGNLRRYCCLDYGLDMLSVHWVAIDEKGHATVYREYDQPNMIPAAAAEAILKLSEGEEIAAYIGPPDLWSRSQESGKSRAALFEEAGLALQKSSRDFPAGCLAMHEWLRIDPDTDTPYMTFYNVPTLWEHLSKIQVDEKNPDVYAKEPHSLTHAPDSLRYFCVWWSSPARTKTKPSTQKWTRDQWEDYKNASPKQRKYLLEKWGHPA